MNDSVFLGLNINALFLFLGLNIAALLALALLIYRLVVGIVHLFKDDQYGLALLGLFFLCSIVLSSLVIWGLIVFSLWELL